MRSSRLILSALAVLAQLARGAEAARSQAAPSPDVRQLAATDSSLRLIVSVAKRRLWVVDGPSDTLLDAPVAVGSARSLAYAGHRWTFRTPRGVNIVVAKEEHPVWVPPDWHFIEIARQRKLAIVWLHGDTSIALPDGSSLVMHDMIVDMESQSGIESLGGEDVVIGRTLFVPPIGSPQRRFEGQLGEYRLLLGQGVGIHGTPDKKSIGRAVTHGCMRLGDGDIEWLYERVPVGTHVYIF